VQKFAVECQGTKHDAVHKHPSYQRGCCAFVKPRYAFVAESEEETLERPAELGLGGRLETDFDGVEGVADCILVSVERRKKRLWSVLTSEFRDA